MALMLTWGMAVFLNENRSFGVSSSWHSGFDVCIIFRRVDKAIRRFFLPCLGQMKYWLMLSRELASSDKWHAHGTQALLCIIFRRVDKAIRQSLLPCLGRLKYWFMLFRELASLDQWHKIKECQNDQPRVKSQQGTLYLDWVCSGCDCSFF